MFFRTRQLNTPSFAVDDVEPAQERLDTVALATALAERLERNVVLIPEPQKPVVKSFTGSHPLIDAVHTAFSRHYPLTLSPDDIWLVIAQGFSYHVKANALRLQGRFVRHTGQQELRARIGEPSLEEFQRAIGDFSAQIREASDPVVHEALICDFSTTTPDIRTASEVVLMDTYSRYFTYRFICVCGIPRVVLTGSVNDWSRMRERLEVLETFELGWWVSRLRPILDQLVESASGRPDREFWQAIYKPRHTYGSSTVTGWIADLFPYLGDDAVRKPSHIFEHERVNWAIPREHGVGTAPERFDPEAGKGVSTKSFPSGVCSVPVKLTLPDARVADLDLVAGFFGVEQSEEDLALSPLIGWSVTERPDPAPPAPQDPSTFFD